MDIPLDRPKQGRSSEAAQPELDFLAIIKAYRAALFDLTGNQFSVDGGAKTCFDPDRLKVLIGISQLAELGIKDQFEVLFITLHELGHLKEFRDDPTGFKGVIERCKKDPDGAAIFDLYNCLMDIYVNHNAAQKAAVFADGRGGFSDLIKELYVTKAFPKHDLTSLPLAEQYATILLLTGMGVARAYTVSEKIQQILDAGVSWSRKQYTYEEFLGKFMRPATGKHKTDTWQGKIGQRDTLIRHCILPIYKQLLEDDKKEGRDSTKGNPQQPGTKGNPQKSPKSSGSSTLPRTQQSTENTEDSNQPQQGQDPGEEQEQGGGEHDDGTPGITKRLTLEELQEFLDAIQRSEDEARKSDQQRAKDNSRHQWIQIAQAADAEQPTDFAERLERVRPVVQKLVKSFLNIRVPSKIRTQTLGHYSNEGVLDVQEGIRKFDKVQRDPHNAEVMRQEEIRLMKESAPTNVRLCLLPDLSGSMTDCIDALRDNVIALAATVATLCAIHKKNKSGIVSELAVYGFDDNLHEILDPIPNASLIHVAKTYNEISARGNTHEALALKHLHQKLQSLRPLDKQLGKTINIAISLTDGDTQQEDESIDTKNALIKDGVHCFGVFLRTGGSNGETFRKIWGDRGYEIDSVEDLPGAIEKIRARIFKESDRGRKGS
jgi:hypothetical protein